MKRRQRFVVASVTAAMVAIGLSGCVEWSTLDHVGDASYSSKSQAEEKWGRIARAPEWIPDDASDIRRSYRTDSDAQAFTLKSEEDAPTSDTCVTGPRASSPEVKVPDAPKPRKNVTVCGPWSVSVHDGSWLAWQNASDGTE